MTTDPTTADRLCEFCGREEPRPGQFVCCDEFQWPTCRTCNQPHDPFEDCDPEVLGDIDEGQYDWAVDHGYRGPR